MSISSPSQSSQSSQADGATSTHDVGDDASDDGLRLLIVEDNDFQRAALVSSLKSIPGATVSEAVNGLEALDRLAKSSFDVVICDLMMDEMDGLEFIRSVPPQSLGALVILSGMQADIVRAAESISRSRHLPLMATLSKPIDTQALKALLLPLRKQEVTVSSMRARVPSLPAPSIEDATAALDQRQIVAFFQPQFDLRSGDITGFEALARWMHPQRGMLAPDYFLPSFEEYGLMERLTHQLLDGALRVCRDWQQAGFKAGVSINVSATTLGNPAAARNILAAAKEHAVDPAAVTIELTESALSQDAIMLLETLTRLRMYGFGVSLDDLGNGYASLQQLSSMPFTEVKVDKSFVTGIAADEKKKSILQSISVMAQNLNLSIVAEGVETVADLVCVRDLGCDIGQGYLVAKPMPADKVCGWLQTPRPDFN